MKNSNEPTSESVVSECSLGFGRQMSGTVKLLPMEGMQMTPNKDQHQYIIIEQ